MDKPNSSPLPIKKAAESFRYYADTIYPGRSPLYVSLAMRVAEDPELLELAAQAWEKKRVAKSVLRRGSLSSTQGRTSSTYRVLPQSQ
jgi:hypothetical protein